ncbi:MAG: arginine--tRNA ligase [Campylobacterota bacterium]|nr:arginine--tRNA ligase [Campylobacterota bacterium]
MKQRVQNLLREKFDRDVVLEKPKDKSFGHFATPIAFSLAKELRKSPMVIAEDLASSFSDDDIFKSVETLKGYINFRLSEKFLNEYATWALENEYEYAMSDKKGSVLLEFVSANPTGPLHIGHARGAVYGDTLARLGRHLGYEITSEYYVNDAGNQIDLLGLSIQLDAASTLFNKEIEYPEKYYRGDYLAPISLEAKEKFGEDILLNESRQKELALWAKDRVLEEIVNTLKEANIKFDTFVNESSLYSDWDRVLEKISTNGIYEKDEKIWLKSTHLGDEFDRVVVREDSRPTYLAGDIIYHNQKFERQYDKYINIWGADHHGYITRVNAAIDFLGYDYKKLEVILSQMVSLLKNGEPFKMSKRSGTVILMSDVLEEIGSDALRFIFASKKCDTALEFDIEDLKKSDSSNPIFYIQYAHARIQTIISKSSLNIAQIDMTPLYDLNEDADSLLFEALLLPEVIDDAFHSRSVQKLPDYLKSLAASLHKFYYDNRVLDTENEAKYLKLFMVVALSIKKGLSLMGIEAKNSM